MRRFDADGLDLGSASLMLRNITRPPREFLRPMDLKNRIAGLERLPVLPDTARRLLEISAKRDAPASELARIVEQDPSLAAQLIRWANSPLYGVRRIIASVQDAIVLLGFDFTFNHALVLASLKPIRLPAKGILGLEAFWHQAVHCAVLMTKLAARLPESNRPPPGITHLAGLLHNIGFLLLGHLFPEEYRFLSTLVESNPSVPVPSLERCALGVTHCELGSWLVRAWSLPTPLDAVTAQHHETDYEGLDAPLVCLTFLADQLLNMFDVRAAPRNTAELTTVCRRLGLSPTEALAQLETLTGLGMPSSAKKA